MINLRERILPASAAGVESTTSWSPVGRHIQLSHRDRLSNMVLENFISLIDWLINWLVCEKMVHSIKSTLWSTQCDRVEIDGLLIHVVDSYDLGPVVQSVVCLTSSLRVISLTVLADSIYNILIFFAEKMWVAFHIFSAKNFSIFAYHSM